jgi:hypothetical protein
MLKRIESFSFAKILLRSPHDSNLCAVCGLQQYQKLQSPGLQTPQSAANLQNQMHPYSAQKQMQQGLTPTSFSFGQQQGAVAAGSYKQMPGQYPLQMSQLQQQQQQQQQQLGRAQNALQRPPSLSGISPVSTLTPGTQESGNKILSKRSIQDLVTQVKLFADIFSLLGSCILGVKWVLIFCIQNWTG